ncbi:MAG: class I SAM-dependent methyltransferase [Planctomycetota bacterium]
MPTRCRIPSTGPGKVLQALLHGARRPGSVLRTLKTGLRDIYRESVFAGSPLPEVDAGTFLGDEVEVAVRSVGSRAGNTSLLEQLVLGALVARRQPRTLVEIGTFDGTTALHLALNSPPDARVFTLDLPGSDAAVASRPLAAGDAAYIADTDKLQRKYADTAVAGKVTQWLGDSATFDFATALQGRRIDLAFIDGAHSYEYVRSDTERLCEFLADGGVLVWHDYAAVWPGVVRWLDELHASRPLVHIAGTALVVDAAAAKPR